MFSGTNPGVAQLGARLTGGQEAVSSSLATRTMKNRLESLIYKDFGAVFLFLALWPLDLNQENSRKFK